MTRIPGDVLVVPSLQNEGLKGGMRGSVGWKKDIYIVFFRTYYEFLLLMKESSSADRSYHNSPNIRNEFLVFLNLQPGNKRERYFTE